MLWIFAETLWIFVETLWIFTETLWIFTETLCIFVETLLIFSKTLWIYAKTLCCACSRHLLQPIRTVEMPPDCTYSGKSGERRRGNETGAG